MRGLVARLRGRWYLIVGGVAYPQPDRETAIAESLRRGLR